MFLNTGREREREGMSPGRPHTAGVSMQSLPFRSLGYEWVQVTGLLEVHRKLRYMFFNTGKKKREGRDVLAGKKT